MELHQKNTNFIDNEDNQEEIVAVEKCFMMQPARNPLHQIAKEAYVLYNGSKTNVDYLTETTIITPRNETVDEINKYMLSKALG